MNEWVGILKKDCVGEEGREWEASTCFLMIAHID